MIPPFGYNKDIQHITGPNYDYYLFSNATPGNWTFRITAVDVPEEGEDFQIITGQVQELVPIDFAMFGKREEAQA